MFWFYFCARQLFDFVLFLFCMKTKRETMTLIDKSVNSNAMKELFPKHRPTLTETIKEHLPNPIEMLLDQIVEMFIKWYNRQILIISGLVMIGLPLYMIILGLIFFHSCPKSMYIPLHMLVCGVTSLIAAILLGIISLIWRRALNFNSKVTYCAAQCTTTIVSFIEILSVLISLAGMVTLTVVLVRISRTVQLHDRTEDFCHPLLYYSSYAILFFVYTILTIIMIILLDIFHAYRQTQQ